MSEKYYVVLDMEWNQPVCPQLMRHDPVALTGEVIEFGAVRVTEDGRPLDTFKTLVSTKYYKKMHSRVARMTGITTAMLQNAPTFPVAAERFRTWCEQMGEYGFITWGGDDIPMLRNNLLMHGMDDSWIPEVYNLQILFNRQVSGENRQWSLTAAAEHLDIAQRWSAHDALHDALYTAIIAGKLDLREGIANYATSPKPTCDGSLERILIERKAPVEIGEIFCTSEICEVVCPGCKERGTLPRESWYNHGPGRKIAQYICPSCEKEVFLRCKYGRTNGELFTAVRTMLEPNEETVALLEKAKAKKQQPVGRRRRKRGGRRKKEAPAEV